ncbi:MAG: caspase family protein [Candidatus Kariarchaeaceae archaeon]
MNKKVLSLFMVMSLFLLAGPVVNMANGQSMTEQARGTVIYETTESPHNYYNNMDQYYYIEQPGATSMRCHFTKIDMESNYDYLYVYDENMNQIYKLSGSYSSGGTTVFIDGAKIILRLTSDYSVTKWGFAVDWYEYEGGATSDTTPPTININSPTSGQTIESSTVAASWSGSDASGIDYYEINIDSGAWTNKGTATTHSYTGISDGAHTINVRAWDNAGNSATDSVSFTVSTATSSGDMDTGVDAYDAYGASDSATILSTPISGTGTIDLSSDQYDQFKVAVSSGDDVTIGFTAPSGATGLDILISNYDKSQIVLKSNVGTFTEVVTASGNGYIYITVDADSSTDTGTYSLSISISGGTGPDDGGELTDGAAAYGHMDATDGADMWYISVGADATSMSVILTCGTADFDTYGRAGAEPTTSTYDWRGYTSGGEENTVSNPAQGIYYIMVDYYSGDADYTLTVTITYGSGGDTWGNGGKYAIVVGISNYWSISDLSYCDEDATDFYNFLVTKGYEVHIFGDDTSNYPRYDGQATEANVRAALVELANHAQSGDDVVFTTSGHGDGTGTGSSYLCMLDCSGSTGCYYDTELAADMDNFALGVDIFVFIDHCYSGGMGPELMAMSNSQYVYCTTTCTEDGYGYDQSSNQNGAWTYEFLEKYLVPNPSWSMEYTFDQAAATYPYSGGDAPMEFDGNTGSSFYL